MLLPKARADCSGDEDPQGTQTPTDARTVASETDPMKSPQWHLA